MIVEVLEPGPLTSVQDATGRSAWRHLGVPDGGAADPWCARLANRLAGNPDDAAVLEMTASGPTLRFSGAAVMAVTGSLVATLDGVGLPSGCAARVRRGAVVRIGSGTGQRGWLAIGGGIDVPIVLGSRSTDLRTGFGGLDGRALRAGDRLPISLEPGRPRRWTGTAQSSGPIRIVRGPHPEGIARLAEAAFEVGPEADRAGVRLVGPSIPGGEVPSLGLAAGAIQVPPDGRPILMLADRPVTGGYRVPAVVIAADLGRVAQLRPGDEVTFEVIGLAEARVAWRKAEEELDAIEPLEAADGDEPGWAGSHA